MQSRAKVTKHCIAKSLLLTHPSQMTESVNCSPLLFFSVHYCVVICCAVSLLIMQKLIAQTGKAAKPNHGKDMSKKPTKMSKAEEIRLANTAEKGNVKRTADLQKATVSTLH